MRPLFRNCACRLASAHPRGDVRAGDVRAVGGGFRKCALFRCVPARIRRFSSKSELFCKFPARVFRNANFAGEPRRGAFFWRSILVTPIRAFSEDGDAHFAKWKIEWSAVRLLRRDWVAALLSRWREVRSIARSLRIAAQQSRPRSPEKRGKPCSSRNTGCPRPRNSGPHHYYLRGRLRSS
jgi:hypothetical protein